MLLFATGRMITAIAIISLVAVMNYTPFTRAQLSMKTTGPGLMTWACGFSGPVYTQFFDIFDRKK